MQYSESGPDQGRWMFRGKKRRREEEIAHLYCRGCRELAEKNFFFCFSLLATGMTPRLHTSMYVCTYKTRDKELFF